MRQRCSQCQEGVITFCHICSINAEFIWNHFSFPNTIVFSLCGRHIMCFLEPTYCGASQWMHAYRQYSILIAKVARLSIMENPWKLPTSECHNSGTKNWPKMPHRCSFAQASIQSPTCRQTAAWVTVSGLGGWFFGLFVSFTFNLYKHKKWKRSSDVNYPLTLNWPRVFAVTCPRD